MTANAPVAEIHLDHIRANFELACSMTDAKMMPVIKANAYGHGAFEVAKVLDQADAYAVARVSEGITLRREVANKPIVVLEGYLGNDEAMACVEHDLTPMLHSDHQLAMLPQQLPYWLKFNTGMFRLGFAPDRAAELAAHLPLENLVGISSHFANADASNHPLNQTQIKAFQEVAENFPGVSRCFANSGVVLGNLSPPTDWVRPGVMLYGGSPTGVAMPALKAGMTLRAPIIAINHLEPGDQLGYGSTWQAEVPCRIAVVAYGYADGYPREMPQGTPALVQGQRRQLVGRVSMDMCTILLEEHDEVAAGDWVTFWGEALSIDEVATCAGTISYTLMTGLGARVQRSYT